VIVPRSPVMPTAGGICGEFIVMQKLGRLASS
jgi:hypothetical protein